MADLSITVDVYLINSQVASISNARRVIGVLFLNVARWLLKSELRVEEVKDNHA